MRYNAATARCADFSADCLQGRNILITGGSGALGQEMIARLLAHGAWVLNVDNHDFPDVLSASLRARLRYQALDLQDLDALNHAFGSAQAVRHGALWQGLDTLICHAGIVLPGDVATYAMADWLSTFNINVHAHFALVQKCLPVLKANASAQRPGRIVFTSSWVGSVPWPGLGAYAPSKAAVDMLAKSLARELATHHIRVNVLAPGIVGAGMALRQWQSDPIYQARAQKAIPVGQLQEPSSVADGMLFLCTRSSDYMTGAQLLIDGGSSLYPMI